MFARVKQKGFTFIELAVAIAIIGVLSALIFSGAASSRKSARVAQRVADLKRVQAALDLYYAKNKSYPVANSWRGICFSYNGGGAYTKANGLWIPGLSPDYLQTIPTDPQSSPSNDANCYLYYSNGADYALLAHQVTELSNGSSGASYAKYPEFFDPIRPTWAWKVSSPGGTGF